MRGQSRKAVVGVGARSTCLFPARNTANRKPWHPQRDGLRTPRGPAVRSTASKPHGHNRHISKTTAAASERGRFPRTSRWSLSNLHADFASEVSDAGVRVALGRRNPLSDEASRHVLGVVIPQQRRGSRTSSVGHPARWVLVFLVFFASLCSNRFSPILNLGAELSDASAK